MNDILEGIEKQPKPHQSLLKHFKIRYWQVVQRCASKGVHTRETTLSRILSGLETANPDLAEQLSIIKQHLLERKLNEREASK